MEKAASAASRRHDRRGEADKFDLGAMLDFKVELALGDQKLSKAEWRQLMAADDGLVLLRGQWVEVDRQKLQEALDHWKQVQQQAEAGCRSSRGCGCWLACQPILRTKRMSETEDREWSFVHAGQWLGEILAKMRGPENLQPVAADELESDVAEVSGDGRRLAAVPLGPGLGACLADDMGLGKTIQVLALLLALNDRGEARKAVALGAAGVALGQLEGGDGPVHADAAGRVRPSGRNAQGRTRPDGGRSRLGARDADLVVTTYGMLLRQEWLLDVQWRLAVLDEAQAIKNPGARQTKTVKRLRADARIALTGTPVENRLSDLWSLFDFLCPGLLGVARQVQGVRQAAGRARGEPLRPAAEPRAAVHSAKAQDRPPHHRRPARKGRGPRVLRAEQASGGHVRQDGRGTGRCLEER